jgi:hypothetical protein
MTHQLSIDGHEITVDSDQLGAVLACAWNGVEDCLRKSEKRGLDYSVKLWRERRTMVAQIMAVQSMAIQSSRTS